MKNIVKDYQWPSSFTGPQRKYSIKYESKIDYKLLNSIEKFFQKHYGYKTILFPSLLHSASILRFLKIDRSRSFCQ